MNKKTTPNETNDVKSNGTQIASAVLENPVTTVMQSLIKTEVASTCINGIIVQNGLTSSQVGVVTHFLSSKSI